MQVATLTATLEAQIAAFQSNMRAADEITRKMREALASLEKQSATTSGQLVSSSKEVGSASKAAASQVASAAEVQVSAAKKQIGAEVAKRKELAKTAVEARAAAAVATQGSDEWVAATTVQLAAEKKLAAGVAAATAVMRERQAAAIQLTSAPAFGGGFVVKGDKGRILGSTSNIEAMKLSETEQARLTELINQTTAATTTGIESEVAARAEQAREIEGTIERLTALRSEQEEGSKEWLAANHMIIASEKELQSVIGETAATAEKIVEAGVRQREQLAKLAAEYRELAHAAAAGSEEQIVAASLAVKAENDLSSAVLSATKLVEEKSNAIQVSGTVAQQAAALNIKANLSQQDTLLALIAEYEAVAAASVAGSREQVAANTLAKKGQTELNALLAVTTKEVKDASAAQVSSASKAIAAGVKQREELAAQVAEYRVVADVARQGSNEQIVAANLALDAERRLEAQLKAVSGEQTLTIAQVAEAKIAANVAEQESLRALIAEYESAAAAGNLSAEEQKAATDLVTAAQRRLNVAIKTGAAENKAAAASAAVKNEEVAAVRAGRGLAAGIGGPGRALAFGSTAFITGIIAALSIRAVVGAATQEEQALKLLQNAMRNNGESWKEWGGTVERSVGKLSAASKFTKEDLFKGLLQLDLATKNVSVAQKDLGVAVNLSRQKQIDLSTAVRDVVLVSEGHASILRRQGIVLPVVTSAQDKLKRMLAGVAAAGDKVTTSSKQQATALAKQADLAATGALDMRVLEQRVNGADAAFDKTTSGHMASFHKALNDLAVAVGKGVIPVMNKVIERFDVWAGNGKKVQAAADAIKKVFNDIVGAAKYFGDAIGLIDRATGSFKNTVIALIGLKLGFWILKSVMNFKELFAVMKPGSFSSVLITVTLLALAIGALSKAFPSLRGAFKTMGVGLAALFVAIKLGWFETMTAMVVSATGASTAIGVAFAATGVGAVIIGFALLAEVVVTHWTQVKHFFSELWKDLKVGWEHMWLWLKLSALHTALDVVEPFSKLPSFLGGWAKRAKNSLLANMDSVRASMSALGASSGNKFGEAVYNSSVLWAKATRKLWGQALSPGKRPPGALGPVGTPGVGPNGDLQGPVGAPVVHLKLPQKLMDMIAAAEAGHGNLAKADAAAYAFYEKQLHQPGLTPRQKTAIYQAEAPYAPAAAFNPHLQTTTTSSAKNILPVAQRIALDKALKEQAAMKPAVLSDANTAQLHKWIQANEAAAEQARKTLAWLKEQHFTGEKLTKSLQLQKQLLNDITAAHRNIAAAMKAEARAAKQAHDDSVNAQAMKILGIGPGGQPVLPGVTSLMGSERSTLISAAIREAKAGTKGKGGLDAEQIANLQKLSLPKLIATVQKMGVEIPKSTLESLRKINEVFALALKEHVKLTADVLTNLRDRLTQIRQDILSSMADTGLPNVYASVTAAQLIGNVQGLTREQKLQLLQAYAQAIAHGGTAPMGIGVLGIPVPTKSNPAAQKDEHGKGKGSGNAPAFASGGIAPGSGVRDTVPAWLTPGEIILNSQHQRMLRKTLGVEGGGPEHLFKALTGGMSRYMSRDPQEFASGGVVDRVRLREAMKYRKVLLKHHITPAYFATHTDEQVSNRVDEIEHPFKGQKFTSPAWRHFVRGTIGKYGIWGGLLDLAATFNPTTRQGAIGLLSMFVPGGKGGRFGDEFGQVRGSPLKPRSDLTVPDFGTLFQELPKLFKNNRAERVYATHLVDFVDSAIRVKNYKEAFHMVDSDLRQGLGARHEEARPALKRKLTEIEHRLDTPAGRISFHDAPGYAVGVPDAHAFVYAVEGAIEHGNLLRANKLLRSAIHSQRWGHLTPVLSKELLHVTKLLKEPVKPDPVAGVVADGLSKGMADKIAGEATKFLEFWEAAKDVKPHSKEAASVEGVAHALHLKLEPLFPKHKVPWPFTDMGGASLPREASINSVKEFLAGRHSQKAIDMWVRMAKRNKNAGGGVIQGYGPGPDDVPAMLSSGEIVFNNRQQRNLRHMLGLGDGTPQDLFERIDVGVRPKGATEGPAVGAERVMVPRRPELPCCVSTTNNIGPVTIVIEGGSKSGAEIAREVQAELIRTSRRNGTQTSGPNAGRSIGLA